MSEKNEVVFFEFNEKYLVISAFKDEKEKIFFNQIEIKKNNTNILNSLDSNIKSNILKIEKILKKQIHNINVILNLNRSHYIKFNIFKKKNQKISSSEDLLYLVQDARLNVVKNNKDLNIIHTVIDSYYYDSIRYEKPNYEIKNNNFSMDLDFICYSSLEIKEFRKLFGKINLNVERFFCYDYLISFSEKNIFKCKDMHLLAYKVKSGHNPKEVEIISKKTKNIGFFERIFDYFK